MLCKQNEGNRVFLLPSICSLHLNSPHLFSHIFFNFMKQIYLSETNSFTPTHDSPCILWNPKVHYLFLKSLQLVHVLRQINPVHTLPTCFLISILMLSSNLCLGPYKWSLSFRSSYKNPSISFTFQACHLPQKSQPSRFNHPDGIWQKVQIIRLLFMQFYPCAWRWH